MEKPIPKREIVINQVWKNNAFVQAIQTYSDDARRWILEEAPQFGELKPSQIHQLFARLLKEDFDDNIYTTKFLTLTIEECYDPADVVHYLIEGYATTPPS